MAPNTTTDTPSTTMKIPTTFKKAHSTLTGQTSSVSEGSAISEHTDDSHPHQIPPSQPLGQAPVQQLPQSNGNLAPPVLVYHESARSIVFRDHLRRAAAGEEKLQQQQAAAALNSSTPKDPTPLLHAQTEPQPQPQPQPQPRHHEANEREKEISKEWSAEWTEMSNLFGGQSTSVGSAEPSASIEIQGFTPNIVPLPHLQLGPNDEFTPLLESDADHTFDEWTPAEKEIVRLLEAQRAVVKTIKNNEWTNFLHRFQTAQEKRSGRGLEDHRDVPARDDDDKYPFTSFVTSTSLLPAGGRKMRSYGNPSVYTTGVVFGLPEFASPEDETAAVEGTRTWSWPSGYSAKTEFNIDSYGNLINGRQEALVPLAKLREYNQDYLTKSDYTIGGRVIQGGLKKVPYNEVFVRVGGPGRLTDGHDCATGVPRNDLEGTGKSFAKGVGLPMALFVRTASFGHLISLLRTRARLFHVWGEKHVHGIPLLYISTDQGIRVLTEQLQLKLLQIASRSLNPFQNPMIAHKTTIEDTDASYLETKLEELIDLDEDIRSTLTPEECVRLAGGFGATDDCIAQILKDAMVQDKKNNNTPTNNNVSPSHRLQDIVNEGLASAVRSGDYYTSRQLLILYSLIAAEGHQMDQALLEEQVGGITDDHGSHDKLLIRKHSLDSEAMLLKRQVDDNTTVTHQNSRLPPPPPPPPLDTDRLRSATNSDGLLAVLGAAQVLKAMQDGSAKKRTEESFISVEEWVEHGEQSMAFRLASWRDQRAAQDDLQIAFDNNSSFLAFVSNKAITNRKNFAKKLRDATKQTDFSDVRFLRAIYEIVERMHSPCLRLELLQYVLGLDNRYSIAHVRRSIELATTCLSIAVTSEPKPV